MLINRYKRIQICAKTLIYCSYLASDGVEDERENADKDGTQQHQDGANAHQDLHLFRGEHGDL